MKKLKLIALSLAGLHRSRYCTANDAAQEPAKDPAADLGIGPFRLPEGIEAKDVRWRIQAGLDPEQAVQAALAQKQADDAEKQAAKADKAAVKKG